MDLIDHLVGIAPGSALDGIRARRAVARAQSVESYRVLFTPGAPGAVSIAERFAVGAYVTGLHGPSPTAEHYMAELKSRAPAALAEAVAQAIAETHGTGPYGCFPKGPLSAENAPGAECAFSPPLAEALGPRLAAALTHAHFLIFHPRDAAPERFAPLLAAGWSTTEIVTLSQIVSFLTYQIRIVAGLRVLADNLA